MDIKFKTSVKLTKKATLLKPSAWVEVESNREDGDRTNIADIKKMYENSNCKLRAIVNLIIGRDYESVSIDDIKSVCGGSVKINDFTRFDQEHRRVALLKKTALRMYILTNDAMDAIHG